jgi:mRNA interferase RelE/StbE
MGSYRIEWKRSALRELRQISNEVIPRIIHSVEQLSSDPFPTGVRKIAGAEHTYRIRIGDYRVIYSVIEDHLLIEIVRVGHRKDVYR